MYSDESLGGFEMGGVSFLWNICKAEGGRGGTRFSWDDGQQWLKWSDMKKNKKGLIWIQTMWFSEGKNQDQMQKTREVNVLFCFFSQSWTVDERMLTQIINLSWQTNRKRNEKKNTPNFESQNVNTNKTILMMKRNKKNKQTNIQLDVISLQQSFAALACGYGHFVAWMYSNLCWHCEGFVIHLTWNQKQNEKQINEKNLNVKTVKKKSNVWLILTPPPLLLMTATD